MLYEVITVKLAEVRRLFTQYGAQAPGYQRSLAQTEEQIQLCMALREKGQALLGSMQEGRRVRSE